MKRSTKIVMFVALMSLLLLSGHVLAQQSPVTKTLDVKKPVGTVQEIPGKIDVLKDKCCIEGVYAGAHKDTATPSKSCPSPKEEKFIMDLKQDSGCGSNVWGTTTGENGSKQDFKGTVSKGPDKCCTIQGTMKKEKEETTFKGVLCKKTDKYDGKGEYSSKAPGKICNGTWEMTQK